jgi:hypothetical protein
MFVTSEDHLDPLLSNFVCGLDQPNNIRHIDLSINKQKSNAFVPYRLGAGDTPPYTEGDICWFLLKGDWVRAPFGGEEWWREATRIGYSRTNTRGTSWYNNGVVSRMFHPDDNIPLGFVEGRIYTGWKVDNFASVIKGKTRAYDPNTGIDGFFDEVPHGYVLGIPLSKRNPGKPKEVSKKWVKEICLWYESGFTTRDVAAILGLTAPTINAILKKNNVPLRPIGGKRGKDLKPRKKDGYSRKQKPLVH